MRVVDPLSFGRFAPSASSTRQLQGIQVKSWVTRGSKYHIGTQFAHRRIYQKNEPYGSLLLLTRSLDYS